jgi:hypothetical protein
MKKLFILIFFYIGFLEPAIAQQINHCPLEVFIDEYQLTLSNVSISDTIIEKYKNHKIIIVFSNCFGSGKLKEIEGNVVLAEGEYCSSLDTLKKYILQVNPNLPLDMKFIVHEYFHPLKNGEWIYKNKKGKVIKKEIWEVGILIKTIKN